MTEANILPPADWDSPWKHAVGALLRPFLAMFFPQAHDEFDWPRGVEVIDKELSKTAPDVATGRQAVDLLFKVWLLNGEERWVLLHIEVQAQRDGGFPRRMYVYNYRTEDRYGRPVASFAVLADDEPGWRPGPYVFDHWGCGGEFRYPTVKISDWADRVEELEASDNPFAVVVLAHLKARETAGDWPRRREWKLRLLKGLRGRGWDQNDALQLYKLIYWFLTLPPNDERLVLAEIKADEKEKQMPYVTIIEKMAMEEGEARGLLAGIALALKVKFGEAGRRLAPEVGAIGDLATLRRVADSIEAAATVEDVRRAWSE